MFPTMVKQGNIDRIHNVSPTMFPSLPKAIITTGATVIFVLSKTVEIPLFTDMSVFRGILETSVD